MKTKNNRKGFTIVELVIVIAVIAILAAVLIPTFGNIIEKANNTKLLQQLENEYTEYTVTVDAAAIKEDIIVKLGDNYYAIDNGVPVTTDGIVTEQLAPSAGTGYWDGDSNVWEANTATGEDTSTDEEPTA